MQTKIKQIIGLLLLIVITGLFIHSELFSDCHGNQIHEQHDYCNIFSKTISSQQNHIKHYIDYDVASIPAIHIFVVYDEKKRVSFCNSYTPLAEISRTIILQSFLI